MRPRTRRCRSLRSAASDTENLADVLGAGASRACVLRAIAADEPQRAAGELRKTLNQ
jgi:thiamine monophosphate synthase